MLIIHCQLHFCLIYSMIYNCLTDVKNCSFATSLYNVFGLGLWRFLHKKQQSALARVLTPKVDSEVD